MLTLLSSSRALLDRWRAGRGSLPLARPISGAIPGVGPAIEALGGMLARRPTPFLLVIGVATLLLGVTSTRIVTEFNTNDFLPSGGEAIRHIETLDAAFGGSTGTVKVLIETEITDDRTVRNILDFSVAFSDDLRRPEGVVSGIESSLGLLLVGGPRRGDAPDDRGGREPERRRRGQCALHHQRHQPGHVGDPGLWHGGQAAVGAPSLHRLPPTRCRCSRFLDTRKGGA